MLALFWSSLVVTGRHSRHLLSQSPLVLTCRHLSSLVVTGPHFWVVMLFSRSPCSVASLLLPH